MTLGLRVPVSDLAWSCPIRPCAKYMRKIYISIVTLRQDKIHPHSEELHSYVLLLLANKCKRHILVMSNSACFKPQTFIYNYWKAVLRNA